MNHRNTTNQNVAELSLIIADLMGVVSPETLDRTLDDFLPKAVALRSNVVYPTRQTDGPAAEWRAYRPCFTRAVA